jgi:hypothetical protein
MVRRYTRRPITPTSNQGSILWTFLLLGLVFCVFDSIYLFYATHNLTLHPDGAGIEFVADQESETSETSPKKQVVNHQVHNQYDKQLSADSDLDSKERVIQIIKDADMESQLTPEIIEKLPTWKQVVDILGPAPRIFGLDSCQAFQDSLDPAEAFIAPAGAFNSGTNLMAELLIANCYNPARRKKYHTDGVRWQVVSLCGCIVSMLLAMTISIHLTEPMTELGKTYPTKVPGSTRGIQGQGIRGRNAK